MNLKKISGMLYQYIGINMLLFLIPFLIILGAYVKSENSREIRNYLELEASALHQTRGQLESVLNELERTASQISYDRKMTLYDWSKGTYESVLATQQLNYYLSGMNGFHDLVVCFGRNESVFRTKGKTDFKTFSEETYQMKGTLESEKLYDLMHNIGTSRFLNASEFLKRGGFNYTVVTYPILSADQKSYATLSGVLETQYMNECLVEQKLASKTIVCNSSGEILLSNAEEKQSITPELLELAKTDSGISQYQENGEKYHVVVLYSQASSLYYIRMISQKTLTAWRIQEMMPSVFLLVVVAVFAILVMSVILAVYNYRPIRNLLLMFDKKVDYKEKQNELLLLDSYIRGLQEKNKSLEQCVAEREREQIQSILIDILFGRYHLEEEDILRFYKQGIDVWNSEFAILTLMCIVDDELKGQILTEYLCDEHIDSLFWITQDPANYFVFLYYAPKGTGGAALLAKQLIEKLQKKGYDCKAGIGGYKDSIENLQISLTEGIISLYDEEESLVHVYDDGYEYERKPQKVNICLGKEEVLLQFAIRKGDTEQIFDALGRLEEEFGNLFLYYQENEIRFRLYRIVCFLTELPGISEIDIGSYVDRMIHYKDTAGFFADFRKCVEGVRNTEKRTREVKGIGIQEILDFMDKHLCTMEMSLAFVAEHFDIRPSYLSTFFKESMGVNFITYIQDKRMEHAKCMLAETVMSIQQIAVGVGYSDVTSFTKKFSSKYGMPPGAYRKMTRSQKNGDCQE